MDKKEQLRNKDRYTMEDLLLLMEILRSPEGCPWDRVQTHESIRRCLLEEAYEVVEALDKDDSVLMKEELGDLLFQVVFHARIEEEKGNFSFSDVVSALTHKMVFRHPHVFGEKTAELSDVPDLWEKMKGEEKHRDSLYEKLSSVPCTLPALMRAEKLQKRAEKCGIPTEILPEDREREDNFAQLSPEEQEKKLGEMLFSLVALGRKYGISCEDVLEKKNKEYIKSRE